MKLTSYLVGGSFVALLGLAAPMSASAGSIVGTLGISGGIIYDTQGLPGSGSSIIDFAPPGGGTGTSGVTISTQTGYFTPVDAFSTATILDLTNFLPAAGSPGPAYILAGVDNTLTPINGFLRNFSDPDVAGTGFPNGLRFDLTQLLNQPGTACVGTETIGQSCVEGPFALQDTNNGVRVNFDVLGYFRKFTGGVKIDEGFFKGSFSTTFLGVHFQNAGSTFNEGLFTRLDVTNRDLGCFSAATGTEGACTFDAIFNNAVIPEPATMATFGLGSALLALVVRRRRAGDKA
jgi:hypothetical protein